MTTTAELTVLQERVLAAVGADWISTAEVSRAVDLKALSVLSALYSRRYLARRRIEAGLMPLEWRLQSGNTVLEVQE